MRRTTRCSVDVGRDGKILPGRVFSLPVSVLRASSIFYWAVGAYLSIRKKGIIHTFRSVIIPVFTVLLIAQIALDGLNTIYGNILFPFFVFTGVAFFWNIKIEGKGVSAAYPGLPFFIFASHLFVLDYVRRGVNFLLRVLTGAVSVNNLDFANLHPFLVILGYCSTIGLTVIVCMLLYMALNRFAPRFCHVLCGR